ncbi:hypothetical protein, partial [Staphylococcus aureus]
LATTTFSSFFYVTSAFNVVTTFSIFSPSLKDGTLTTLLVLSAAPTYSVNIGHTAFLSPSTFPCLINLFSPLITNLYIVTPPLSTPITFPFP